MTFASVDIETGEQINLCMGDIARAARISCTLPGVFEPVRWGNRTLIDGGLLSLVPLDALKQFPVDITVGINMRGTKHIFTERQISLKKVLNVLGKMLFLNHAASFLRNWNAPDEEDVDFEENPGVFSVVGKSLNLAIAAQKQDDSADLSCDLMITPTIPFFKGDIGDYLKPYYDAGLVVGYEYGPKIKNLIAEKQKQASHVTA
jgi:predicted acylesterase/phospholipase RssA